VAKGGGGGCQRIEGGRARGGRLSTEIEVGVGRGGGTCGSRVWGGR